MANAGARSSGKLANVMGSQGWQTGEREGAQQWQTGEREGSQRWNTGEREGTQAWQTGEREGTQEWQTGENKRTQETGILWDRLTQQWQDRQRRETQDWQTGEREGGQDWQSGENQADRTFQLTMQDDMQDFQTKIQNSEQGFIRQENALNRELETYKVDLQNAAEHRNLDIVADRNQQIRRVEAQQASLERRKFKLEILQSFAASPEMLFFMGQNSDPAKIFGELFSEGDGGSGENAGLQEAMNRMMSDVQDPRFAANLQSYSRMGGEEQAQSRYAQTARTGDRNPEQTLRNQAPLSMPSRQVTRQVEGRVR